MYYKIGIYQPRFQVLLVGKCRDFLKTVNFYYSPRSRSQILRKFVCQKLPKTDNLINPPPPARRRMDLLSKESTKGTGLFAGDRVKDLISIPFALRHEIIQDLSLRAKAKQSQWLRSNSDATGNDITGLSRLDQPKSNSQTLLLK